MLSKNLNIFREKHLLCPFPAFFLLLAGLFLICLFETASAIIPNRSLAQYRHDRWGTEKGFPGGTIYSLAQTPDGFLWIGTEKGLVRFDGLNFQLIQSGEHPVLPAGSMLGLMTDGEGNLWIRPQTPNILRYREGRFEDVLTNLERIEPRITAMNRGKNGEILISTLENGILKNDGEKFVSVAAKPDLPESIIISLAETPAGEIWFGTRDDGLFRLTENRVSAVRSNLLDRKINCLLPDGENGLWIGTDQGIIRWDGAALTRSGVPPALDDTQILTILRDRDSNIWFGTDSRGLLRFNSNGLSAFEKSDVFQNEAVTAIFEDREGNLWFGGNQGIERLRESAFQTYTDPQNSMSESSGALFIDAENRAWLAPLHGGLAFIDSHQIEKKTVAELEKDIIYSISGGKNNLWLGTQRGGLTNLYFNGTSSTAKTYTQNDGLAQNSVFAVHQSRDGAVWAGTLSGGVSRFKDGKFTNYTSADGLISNTINAIAESSEGGLWFATPNGLSGISNARRENFTVQNGLPSNNLNCLLADPNGGLWIGTSKGIAVLHGGRVQSFPNAPAVLQENILGMAMDKNNALWIATANHVLQLDRDKLLNGQIAEADIRLFDFADGLLSTEGLKRHQTVVADADGKIWFSLKRGVSVVDPQRMKNNSAPALVQIRTIAADGRQIDPRQAVSISSASQKIVFSFAGLSLSVPERVRFRYRLEGFDVDWSEPTANREAVYTNLSPGTYSFRVIASNSDGVWNSMESTVNVEIKPVFWQTWWFRLFCLLIFVCLILVVYRLRLLRLTRKLNMRFEERLAERMIIAQELHDSLLQGVVSASMQLNVAAEKLPARSPAKRQLNRVIELMGEVIKEGRNTVRGLRSVDHNFTNLEQAFSQIPKKFNLSEQTDFRLIVEGLPRPLCPAIRDEVYLIGREAVINAFRHAKANKIEVELEFAAKQFKVLVRDDGRGIDQEILQTGRDGHWGLSVMRERAEKIGARLTVYSRAGAGTEIELSVPNHIAFETEFPARPVRWMTRLLPRKEKIRSSEKEQTK